MNGFLFSGEGFLFVPHTGERKKREVSGTRDHLSSDDHGVVSRDARLLRGRLFGCLFSSLSLSTRLLQLLISQQHFAFLQNEHTQLLHTNSLVLYILMYMYMYVRTYIYKGV